MILFDTYEKYKAELEGSPSRYNDILILQQAKTEIDSGELTVQDTVSTSKIVLGAVSDAEDFEFAECNA